MSKTEQNSEKEMMDEQASEPVEEDPRDLIEHPKQVYETDVSERFINSIENEVLQPVKVLENSHFVEDDGFVIVSGHRRVKAAIEAGLDTVPIEVMEAYDSPESEEDALHEYNDYRNLSFKEQMKVAAYLMDRQKERPELGSTKREAKENIADRVGIGGRTTLTKAMKIWEAAQEDDDLATELVDNVDSEEKSIHAAHEEWKDVQEQEEIAKALKFVREADTPDGWECTDSADDRLTFEKKNASQDLSVKYDLAGEEYVIIPDGDSNERINNVEIAVETVRKLLEDMESSESDDSSKNSTEEDPDKGSSSDEGNEGSSDEDANTNGTDSSRRTFFVSDNGTIHLPDKFAGKEVTIELVEEEPKNE